MQLAASIYFISKWPSADLLNLPIRLAQIHIHNLQKLKTLQMYQNKPRHKSSQIFGALSSLPTPHLVGRKNLPHASCQSAYRSSKMLVLSDAPESNIVIIMTILWLITYLWLNSVDYVRRFHIAIYDHWYSKIYIDSLKWRHSNLRSLCCRASCRTFELS